ncbi:MAG: hypothetical protein WAN50_03595 [Minisyncoccia bacterium]
MEPEKIVPQDEAAPEPGVPSRKAQSWGAVVSIIVIMLMIIIGAFYAWGQRVAQDSQYQLPAAAQ